MKKTLIALALILAFSISLMYGCSGKDEQTESVVIDEALYEQLIQKDSDSIVLDSNTAVKAAREVVWEEYKKVEKKNETRIGEIKELSMDFGDKTMRYFMSVRGKAGANGYPVYICLHGGGETEPEFNDSQWEMMTYYYIDSVDNGIYIATRGITNHWNLHFDELSYPLYEHLIENLSIFYHVDTNRIYLIGYSAGGDGVYQVTARLADRFGAVNMSAGHHNGVNLTNLYNTPIQLQVGQLDDGVNRNVATPQYEMYLRDLQNQYNGGYEHNTFIHIGKPHNFYDNDPAGTLYPVIDDIALYYNDKKVTITQADTNSVHFVSRYTRNPIPTRVIWDLSVRANYVTTDTFFWLGASMDYREGLIIINREEGTNTINIEQRPEDVEFRIMLREDMVDMFKPVTVNVDGKSYSLTVTPSLDVMRETIADRSDPEMSFAAYIYVGKDGVPYVK